MLDRVLKFIIVATFGLFFLQAAFGVLARILEEALQAVGHFSHALAALLIVSFALGVLVRVLGHLRGLGSTRRGQGRGSAEWSARAYADDVPVDRRRTRRSRSLRSGRD